MKLSPSLVCLSLLLSASACEEESPDPLVDASASSVEMTAASEDAGAAAVPDASVPQDAAPTPDADDASIEPAEPPANAMPDDIPEGPNVVKIVAPSVCPGESSLRLFMCDFGPVELEAPNDPGPGMFKTRVTGHMKGNCSGTLFPFVAKLSAEGVDEQRVDIFLNDEHFVRRNDGTALKKLLVENGSGFKGAYPPSCRVWMEVAFNLPAE